MKKLILLASLLLSTAAQAFTPWQGLWWNPSESGSGYNMDMQNGVLVVTVYSYKESGDSEWYLASGPVTQSGKGFTGTLDKYRFGPCVNCSYSGSPARVGNDGAISIVFSDETHAVMQLAGREQPPRRARREADAGPQQVTLQLLMTGGSQLLPFAPTVDGHGQAAPERQPPGARQS